MLNLTPVIDEGGCTDGDKGVGAMLLEWALVFLDMTFLNGIKKILLIFISKMGMGLSFSANLLL